MDSFSEVCLYQTRKDAEKALRVFGKQDAQIAACEIVEVSDVA